MDIEKLIANVPSEWRVDFRKFIDTGEASTSFEEAIDSNPDIQNAVEQAFEAKSTGFEEFAREVARSSQPSDVEEIARVISGGIVRNLDAVTKLQPAESEHVLDLTAAQVASAEPEGAIVRIQDVLMDLRERLKRRLPTAGAAMATHESALSDD